MSGDFLQNLYLLIGFFVAFTAFMWLFSILQRRDSRRLAGDLKNCISDFGRSIRRELKGLSKSVRRMEKGIRREIRRLDENLSGELRGLSREVRGLGEDMQEVKDLLGIETDFCPQRSRSGTDDGGRDR